MKELARLIDGGRFDEARRRLQMLSLRASRYTEVIQLGRARARLAAVPGPAGSRQAIRVALLGTATTDLFTGPLTLELEARGFTCEIFTGGYNAAAAEILNPESPVVAFAPHVTVIVNTPLNMSCWPQIGDSLEQVQRAVDQVCDHWLRLCARLHERTGCDIVLDNFHPLPTRPLGNLGSKLPWDPHTFLRRINLALGERAPSYVHIADVETLASQYGVRQWFDSRYWYHAKQPVSCDSLVPYVRNHARIIAAVFGRTAKCLVLDLDNTLWGGVVGDDGIDGLEIGPGSALGEAYAAFQQYILALRKRGVMLAVCSKNDEETALRPFKERPEMILKREDLVAFKANWRPKPENLQEIAAELNIGLDALVFVDDNPAEREQIRQFLPDVHVVDLTDDAADYPRLLDDAGLFEAAALSQEDQQRTAQYRQNAERDRLRETLNDYGDYLASLEQKAVIRPFEEPYLNRITQLVNKTNQFNLTTRRMSRSDLECAMVSPNVVTAYVRVADRFGDNGLIGVFMAGVAAQEATIEQWLMSCRVLNRGVEQLLMNHVVRRMRDLGIRTVYGLYKPTSRNGIVRDHYRSLGFTLVAETDGETTWSLDIAAYRELNVSIALVESY